MADSEFMKVAETGDISVGEMRPVKWGDQELLLANVEGKFYAISNSCTHREGVLTDGELSGEQVQCPLHGAAFNVITGEVLNPPARRQIRAHEVRISGNDILVGPGIQSP